MTESHFCAWIGSVFEYIQSVRDFKLVKHALKYFVGIPFFERLNEKKAFAFTFQKWCSSSKSYSYSVVLLLRQALETALVIYNIYVIQLKDPT